MMSLMVFGYSKDRNDDFQFLTVNHVYEKYSNEKILSTINFADTDKLKFDGQVIFSDFYSPNQILLVITKYENETKLYFFYLYNLETGLINFLFEDSIVGQDLFYLNKGVLYRYDGENLIAFNLIEKKTRWSYKVYFFDHVEKFWYDELNDLMFANCNNFSKSNNFSFQINSVEKNSCEYRSKGSILGFKDGDLFYEISSKLFYLKTQTMNYQSIDISYNKIDFLKNSFFTLLTNLNSRLIIGIETRKHNFLAQILFGHGYNSKFNYYICTFDSLNYRIESLEKINGVINTANIKVIQ